MADDERIIGEFAGVDEFRAWLHENHAQHPGVWLRIGKGAAAATTISYQDALLVALEFGWIDGPKNAMDSQFWLQRFTHRRPRSVWSKRNVELVTTMIENGTLRPSGLAEVEAAKADGRWERAYEGSAGATPTPEFLAALDANPDAKAFYEKLNAANRYALYYRIQSAKREDTRARRIATFVEMLARGEAFH